VTVRSVGTAESPAKACYEADSLAELLNQRQELNWLIEGWLEQSTLALLVGAEGSFKSFLAIDWALRIATGCVWQGQRTVKGPALFIPGEGRTGVIRRMRGWCQHFGENDVDEVLLGRNPIQLLDSWDAERIAALGPLNLVVVDTLARNFGPGSENDQKDMAAAIHSADQIREKTGATVLIVHHTPLEGRATGKLRPRGSSALAGAADAIFTCEYDKDSSVITVSNSKQKDAQSADTRFLSFEKINLDETDNFDNPITTVTLCATHQRPRATRKVTGRHQRRLIQELRSLANGSPELLVAVRDITATWEISREARRRLEQWFRDAPWTRHAAGGHLVDLESLPAL
jgi:hypothetical protein